jgi:hypothetical protein
VYVKSDFILVAGIVLGKESQYPLIRSLGGAGNNLFLLPGIDCKHSWVQKQQ